MTTETVSSRAPRLHTKNMLCARQYTTVNMPVRYAMVVIGGRARMSRPSTAKVARVAPLNRYWHVRQGREWVPGMFIG